MRHLVRVLLLLSVTLGPISAFATEPEVGMSPVTSSTPDVSEWDGEKSPQAGTEIGFAPLSVTQSGVAYTPPEPAFDPAARDEAKIADLPAWASSDFTDKADRRATRSHALGALGFGALPEPAAWALILIGTAMICGALRGLIMANRRLARLRDDDEAAD